MQRLLLPILICLGLTSGEPEEGSNIRSVKQYKASQTELALRFINEYVENCDKLENAVVLVDWIESNQLVTESFKAELTRIVAEAKKKDPELGLDFDPIFHAQDYPEKGFKLESVDESSGYLVVQGINWPQFRLRMKAKHVNGKWLLDGCGIINIPADQRIQRYRRT